MTPHHQFTTLSSGIKLHHTAWGDPCAQTVVCVHGVTRNARDFDALAAVLATKYHVLCLDVMGRGQSAWATNTADYTVPVYAQQVLEWLDLNGIIQPHWVGTSMGGLIAMTVQLIAPNRFEKLVMNDVGPVIERVALERIAKYIGQQPQFASRAEAQTYAREIFKPFGAKTEAEWASLTDYYFIDQPDGSLKPHYDPAIANMVRTQVAAMTDESTAQAQAAMWASVKSLTHPCLVLRGEHSDLLSSATVAALCDANPLIEAKTITGCGHAPHLMDTLQTHAILDFLLDYEPL